MILVVAAVLSIGMLISSVTLSHDLLRENLATILKEIERAKGDLEILNSTLMSDRKTILVEVLNRGPPIKAAADFPKIDVFLVYRPRESQNVKARWIPYDLEKSIIITIHPYAFNQDLLVRMRSICDVHFTLMVKEVGEKIVKMLQVPKLKGAVKPASITLSFDVDPAFGIKILPFSQARA